MLPEKGAMILSIKLLMYLGLILVSFTLIFYITLFNIVSN